MFHDGAPPANHENLTNPIPSPSFVYQSLDIAVSSGSYSFYDDFSTNTTGEYTTTHTWTEGGIGSFTYDAAGKRARVLTGDNVGLRFSHNLTASESGTFSIDFLPTVKYPSGGWFQLRLLQDGSNYYELQHTDGYGPGYIRKVVGGAEADKTSFHNQYSQNNNYHIIISFSPNQTTVSAFGEILALNGNPSGIIVSSFEIEVPQQGAYFDNIDYTDN